MLMRILKYIVSLLLLFIANSAFAVVHLSTTPYYQVSKEEIIGGITVCADGNVMMFSRFLRGEDRARLLILSPESKLLEEHILEYDMPVFLNEVKGKKLIGFIQGSKTIIRFFDDSYERIFPEEIPWLNTHTFNNKTFLLKIYGDPPDLYIQKIIESGSPADSIDSKLKMKDFLLPQNLFADGENVYYLKDSLKKKGIYKLVMDDGLPRWELFLEGKFFQANAIFNDVHKLLFVVPSKILVQNELQVRSLPDGSVLERLHFIHDAIGLSAASSGKYALLEVSAKATLNSGELIVFNQEGKVILRDKESWKKGYSILGFNPVNESFIVQEGFNQIKLIKVIE